MVENPNGYRIGTNTHVIGYADMFRNFILIHDLLTAYFGKGLKEDNISMVDGDDLVLDIPLATFCLMFNCIQWAQTVRILHATNLDSQSFSN